MTEQQEYFSQDPPKLSIRKDKWRLLLISDHGKIRRIPGYKILIRCFFFILALSLAANAGLYYLYKTYRMKNEDAKTSLARSKESLAHLSVEKELLIARLVLEGVDPEAILKQAQPEKKAPESESAGPNNTKTEKDQSEKESGQEGAGEETPRESAKERVEKSPSADAPPENEKTSPQEDESNDKQPAPRSSEIVALEDFESSYSESSKSLRIRFKLDNKADDKLSGYIIVLLKNLEKKPATWIALPDSPLENGEPADYKTGRYFEIARFKTIRFKVGDISAPDLYTVAEIYIFGKDGDLVLKRQFTTTDAQDGTENENEEEAE